MYRPNSDIIDLNQLRYKMFCKTTVKNPSLPPSYDSMLQHLKRCIYQNYIWKSDLIAQPDIDFPVGYGWSMTDSELSPKTQAEAPKKLDELTLCQCKQSKCASRSCKCVKADLLCSPACGCEGDSDLCENTVKVSKVAKIRNRYNQVPHLENQDEENMPDYSYDQQLSLRIWNSVWAFLVLCWHQFTI